MVTNTQDHIETLYSFDLEDFFQEGYEQKSDRDSTYVVLYTHCLPSFLDLIEFIVESGVLAGNIFVIPKLYSAVPSTVGKLDALGVKVLGHKFEFGYGHFDQAAREHVAVACKNVQKYVRRQANHQQSRNRVVLVDDGGLLTDAWTNICNGENTDTVSVQQTASGMYDRNGRTPIPYINVAQCAAKRWFESKIIATGLLSKVNAIDEIDYSKRLGVAGFGAVGSALVDLLVKRSVRLNVHDVTNRHIPAVKKFRYISDQKAFLKDSDIIFGCVGRDWIDSASIRGLSGEKLFISCSSRDVEFGQVFRNFELYPTSHSQFSDLTVTNDGQKTILNAGFPINFDREVEYEKLSEIVITRALILAAVIQARCVRPGAYSQSIKLSCVIQKQIVSEWLRQYSSSRGFEQFGVSEKSFNSIEWWHAESKGKRYSDFL